MTTYRICRIHSNKFSEIVNAGTRERTRSTFALALLTISLQKKNTAGRCWNKMANVEMDLRSKRLNIGYEHVRCMTPSTTHFKSLDEGVLGKWNRFGQGCVVLILCYLFFCSASISVLMLNVIIQGASCQDSFIRGDFRWFCELFSFKIFEL